MKKIVAIVGGEICRAGYSVETGEIDKEIIRLSGKKNPKLLFIPTASSDSELYYNDIKKHFGDTLECETDALYLIKEKPSKKEIEKKIFGADIIYVGGGNTLKMMKVWRAQGVDNTLKQCYDKGISRCGVSAGAICWFEAGHSDSMKYYKQGNWDYIKVKGIGLAKGIFCPHYDGMTLGLPRKDYFQQMIKNNGGFGIAVEKDWAIEIVDGKYFKIIASTPGASAYKVFKNGKRVVSGKIEQKAEMAPIEVLYKKS